MGIFCWILAVDIAAPLKTMAEGMTRFGAGDLNARLGVKRADEIGRLSQSFDAMADRIQLLLHAERRLLQDISHELRSPLARLSVAGQLIKREDKRVEATAQIERETERLGVLIGDLVAVTRAEGDPAASRRELVRLDLLVEEIVENCAMEADMKNCRIAVLNEVGELELQGVQELLWRAIENVLRNAILHSPPRGIVEVTLTRRGDREAQVSIRDSGPGVPPQQLDDIFQPFYRIDESRNAKTGGVGLGLAIAQRAINLHHGEIVAENADPGLRVQIRLPI
jgi:two-component system sensor histidine kinase CpxA